jgi:hypothetical protein
MDISPGNFLREQCSCGGSNPNCYKCGGWGYIDRIGQGRASDGPAGTPGHSPTRRMSRKAARVAPVLIRCPHCGVKVQGIGKHLKKSHGIQAPEAPPRAGLVKCPSCTSFVREDRIALHIQRVHQGHAFSSPRDRVGVRATKSSPRFQSDTEQRSHDATRDYARSFRDYGQFGSHPSHDGFDDESTP